MSELDDSRSSPPEADAAPEADATPEGFEDTVVEILSLGDEADDVEAELDGDLRTKSVGERRLESLVATERERMLRLRADFDNYRKRTERERGEIERFALADALREILPVVDNLERALEAQGAQSPPADPGELRKGVEMIVRQFHEVLRRNGLSPIPAVGERFDPSVHEAVFQEESESVTEPTVAVELQRGYRLNDRLLRPSLVKVAVPRDSSNGSSASDSE